MEAGRGRHPVVFNPQRGGRGRGGYIGEASKSQDRKTDQNVPCGEQFDNEMTGPDPVVSDAFLSAKKNCLSAQRSVR